MPLLFSRCAKLRGITQKDLKLILRKVRSGLEELWLAEVKHTGDELYPRQTDRGIDVSSTDRSKLAYRYSSILRKAAARLTSELHEAYRSRGLPSEKCLEYSREAIKSYLHENTSTSAADDVFREGISRYFTVLNEGKARRQFAQALQGSKLRRLLAKHSEEELEYIRAKVGTEPKERRTVRKMVALPAKKIDLSNYIDNASLTDRQKEVFSLSCEYGIPVAGIARRLGLHRKTIYEYLAVANKKIEQQHNYDFRKKRQAITRPGELT